MRLASLRVRGIHDEHDHQPFTGKEGERNVFRETEKSPTN
jgi:hypothetical protein